MNTPKTKVITNPIDITNQLDIWLTHPFEDEEDEYSPDMGIDPYDAARDDAMEE